jgi:N-acetyl-gamma-glutamyl-phosphate reductase
LCTAICVPLPKGAAPPQTGHVRGSNRCVMVVVEDREPGRAIVVRIIDIVVKGASGQAVQNMNLMFGLSEEMELVPVPVFPCGPSWYLAMLFNAFP